MRWLNLSIWMEALCLIQMHEKLHPVTLSARWRGERDGVRWVAGY